MVFMLMSAYGGAKPCMVELAVTVSKLLSGCPLRKNNDFSSSQFPKCLFTSLIVIHQYTLPEQEAELSLWNYRPYARTGSYICFVVNNLDPNAIP
jgi:hypothetical protein